MNSDEPTPDDAPQPASTPQEESLDSGELEQIAGGEGDPPPEGYTIDELIGGYH